MRRHCGITDARIMKTRLIVVATALSIAALSGCMKWEDGTDPDLEICPGASQKLFIANEGQWSYGNDILNANRLIFESSFAKRPNLNQFATYADRWTFDNPDSDIPCVNASAGSLVYSSRVIEDGSYLRIKDVVLGYTFPQKWMKKVKISRLRLYVSAQNLHTFTSYSGYDPEVSIRNTALTPGLDYSAYPRSINFNFGLNLSF